MYYHNKVFATQPHYKGIEPKLIKYEITKMKKEFPPSPYGPNI